MLNTGNRRRFGSGLLVAGLALVVLVSQILLGMRLTEGHWVYTLDDAYIHLAMARTLALDGVWGVALHAFAACSSSPLWTLLLALVVVAAAVGHVTFSQCGRFYRYEAYLMAAGFLLLAVAWLPFGRLQWRRLFCLPVAEGHGWLLLARAGFLMFLLGPLFLRGAWATSRVPRASANIYQQQWQMARIFKTMDLQNKAVAINDLGLMADRSGARLVDLWGLGTTEIALAKCAGRYDQAYIADLLVRHDVGYVAVYDDWFDRGRELPEDLIAVARLTIPQNVVCLHETVTFYATGQAEARKLREHLRRLPFELPQETRIELVP